MSCLIDLKKYPQSSVEINLSYTVVTVGALLLTVLILGFLLFSTILAPHELILLIYGSM